MSVNRNIAVAVLSAVAVFGTVHGIIQTVRKQACLPQAETGSSDTTQAPSSAPPSLAFKAERLVTSVFEAATSTLKGVEQNPRSQIDIEEENLEALSSANTESTGPSQEAIDIEAPVEAKDVSDKQADSTASDATAVELDDTSHRYLDHDSSEKSSELAKSDLEDNASIYSWASTIPDSALELREGQHEEEIEDASHWSGTSTIPDEELELREGEHEEDDNASTQQEDDASNEHEDTEGPLDEDATTEVDGVLKNAGPAPAYLDEFGRPLEPLVDRKEILCSNLDEWYEAFQDTIRHWTLEQYNDWQQRPTSKEWWTRQRVEKYMQDTYLKHVSEECLASGAFGEVRDIAGQEWDPSGRCKGPFVIKTMLWRQIDELDDSAIPKTPESLYAHLRSSSNGMMQEFEILQRFKDEPQIVNAFTCLLHTDGLAVSIILEKAVGGSLFDWNSYRSSHADDRGFQYPTKPGRLTPIQARTMISDISSALLAMHSQGYGHFDLKAGNILIVNNSHPSVAKEDAQLRFILADFGLATKLDASALNTRGTATYLPPEVINHGDGYLVASADMYALGVVAMEAMNIAGMRFARDVQHRLEMIYRQGIYDDRFADWMDLLAFNPQRRPSADLIRSRCGHLNTMDERYPGKSRAEKVTAHYDDILFRWGKYWADFYVHYNQCLIYPDTWQS